MIAKSAGSRMTSSIETEPRSSRRRRRLLDVAGLTFDIGRHGRDHNPDDGDHGDGPEHVLRGHRATLVSAGGSQLVEGGRHRQLKKHQEFQHEFLLGSVLPCHEVVNMRSNEGATSRAMKMTPSSEPGMVIRSPTAFAWAISSLII